MTLAKVGIPGGTHNSVVAIGTPANVACKLMRLIPYGGICIGNFVYRELPNNWSAKCTKIESSSGFVYREANAPYQAWTLDYRIPASPPPLSSFGSHIETPLAITSAWYWQMIPIDQQSSGPPLDFLWNVHSYTNEYIRFADAKAAFVVTIAAALVGPSSAPRSSMLSNPPLYTCGPSQLGWRYWP